MVKVNYDPFKIVDAFLASTNDRNPVPWKALLAPGATFRYVFQTEEMPFPAGLEQFEKVFRVAFPDLKFVVTNIIPTPVTLTVEWTVTGTHKGPFMAIPATGRIGTTAGATVFKLNADGLVSKEIVYLNLVDVLNNLGALTPPLDENKLREKALDLLDAFNKHDVHKIVAMLLPAAPLLINNVPVRDPAETLLGNFTAIPDLKFAIDQLAIRGNQVVIEITNTGTPAAPWNLIPATGRPAKWNACYIITFKGEKVERLNLYIDQYTFLVKEGVIPQPVAK